MKRDVFFDKAVGSTDNIKTETNYYKVEKLIVELL